MMTRSLLADARPRYVPTGYRYGFRVEGEAAAGFWGNADQVLLNYTFHKEPSFPLTIFAAAAAGGDVLHGTEHRTGMPVDLGVPGVSAVYHDGLWATGPGRDQQVVGQFVLHWDDREWHSITIRARDRVFAVRGARSNGVTVDELTSVARSLALER
jgi:hypothetical protein